MKRRHFLQALAATAVLPSFAHAQVAPPVVEVWRSPTCGCCGAWIKHLQENGFATKVNMVDDTSAARKAAGIPERLGSCHTGKVGGYAIEGHVPAADIRKLLATKPQAVGLAVPGMPVGSPGMEQGNLKQPYDVLLVKANGTTEVFARHS
jgi:hypothetical protein